MNKSISKKYMRNLWISSIAILFLLILSPTIINAESNSSNIYVTVDGRVLTFEQPPVIMDGNTLVPLRAIFEALGATVGWVQETQTINARNATISVSLQIGVKKGWVVRSNQQSSIDLEVAPQIINGSTLVPVRFVSESLGSEVSWDSAARTVIIKSTKSKDAGSTPSSVTGPTPIPEQIAPPKLSTISVEEVGKLGDRVVYIEILDSNYKALGSGSGIVTKDGILTNYHVVKDAVHLKIEFTNGESYISDELLLKDADRDLALVKPSGNHTSSIAIFGDSSKITLGQQIVTVGSPLGFKNSLTTGVVSSTSRMISGYSFIQLSAPIDHGSSGGALFNMSGQVIGVVSATFTSQAEINLAIPSNDVISFLARPKQPETLSKKKMTYVELETYLNNNYSSRTFKNYVYHLTYKVIEPASTSVDGTLYSIIVNLSDMGEYLNFFGEQIKDETVYPALIGHLSDQLKDNLGITDTFWGLYLTTYVTYYPSSFPPVSIKSQGTGYSIVDTLVYGKIYYNEKMFRYTIYPNYTFKKSVELPLN